jgi:hypothetical protein
MYEDALKISNHLACLDSAGLVFLRRLCERLVNHLCRQHGLPSESRATLAEKTQALSSVRALSELQKHSLNLFRFLGNATAHDAGIPDSELLPDADAAFHVMKLSESVIKHMAHALDAKPGPGRR